MSGPTRSGKSTLAALLGIRMGATVISDDWVTVRSAQMNGAGIPISIRADSPIWASAHELWYADDSSRLMVRTADLGAPACAYHGPIDLLLFPTFGSGAPFVRSVAPAEVFCRLVAALFHPCAAAELDAIADLATVPATTISYSNADESLELCRSIFESTELHASGSAQPLTVEELNIAGFSADVSGYRFGTDAALWSRSLGTVAQLHDWTGGPFRGTEAWYELSALGLIDMEEVRRYGRCNRD